MSFTSNATYILLPIMPLFLPCREEISKRYNLHKGRGGIRSDIYDGAVYQHLFHTGFLSNKHNVVSLIVSNEEFTCHTVLFACTCDLPARAQVIWCNTMGFTDARVVYKKVHTDSFQNKRA